MQPAMSNVMLLSAKVHLIDLFYYMEPLKQMKHSQRYFAKSNAFL